MAELTPRPHWSSTQTRSQFATIVWLRWRIMVNSFRRKGGSRDLVGHAVLALVFAAVAIFFIGAAGFAAYYFVSHGLLDRVAWILWAIFVLCQLLNIQLGQPETTFDPTQLIRFPLGADTYITIRLFFGLLTPANIAGTLMSFAVAAGISLAIPALWLYALLALAVFAATNVLFSRMIFAWVDRWLSTRRAREIFTAIIFAGSLAIQWANLTFNPAYHNHTGHMHGLSPQQIHFTTTLYHRAQPFLAALPPELTTSSLSAASRSATISFALYTLACALFAALFFAIFALRMRSEFHGEIFSDAAGGISRKVVKPSAVKLTHSSATPVTATPAIATPEPTSGLAIPPIIITMLGKEFLYVRRHMGILYGLIMPIFLVLIFAGKFAFGSQSLWVFPAAVAYTLLAVCPLSYNSFGFEAEGSQFYFLAPVRMRDILLAKNLFTFLMALVEILIIFGVISYMAEMPSADITAASLLWAAGTLAISTTFGNRRSIIAPKKINPQRMANKQTSQLSAFMSLFVLALSAAVAAALFGICLSLHLQWALVPVFALFAAIAIVSYVKSLGSLDQFALDHREELFAVLCKQT